MKYNRPEEHRLLEGYAKAVDKGHISPLVGFEQYKAVSDQAEEELTGIKVAGVRIKNFTTHFIDRVIGQTSDSHKNKRKGTPIEDVKYTLEHPKHTSPEYKVGNDTRVKITGKKATVTISISDKRIIQSNPGGTDE